MSRETLLEVGCWSLTAAAALALLALHNPNSWLSRLVDRPADDTTNPKARR